MKTIIVMTALAVLSLAPALADDDAVPPWNVGGNDWICVQQCQPGLFGKPTQVIQDGRRFVFVDESGTREPAEWMGGFQISFIGCDNDAIVSPDLRRIEFIFGSVWVR